MGLFDETSLQMNPGNSPPSLDMTAPANGLTWRVGDAINFSATGSDAQDGTPGAAAFSWTFEMMHCLAGTATHTSSRS